MLFDIKLCNPAKNVIIIPQNAPNWHFAQKKGPWCCSYSDTTGLWNTGRENKYNSSWKNLRESRRINLNNPVWRERWFARRYT